MLAGLSKQTLVVGSAPGADIVLSGQGVAPEHARIVNMGAGRMVFIPLAAGCTGAGAPLAVGQGHPFDLRTPFNVGGATVPLDHPALCLSLMARGEFKASPGEVVIGRDPTRASIVVQHPSVSGRHFTLRLDRMMVVDHTSTSGTYVGTARIRPDVLTPVPPNGSIAAGVVHLPVATLLGAYEAFNAPQPSQPQKAKTILGEIGMSEAGGPKRIGRAADCDIVLAHPQVSSHHATLHEVNGKLFIEDMGSANGTFVRGQRIAPNQKIAVDGGERIYIGPMPLQIELSKAGTAQFVQEDFSADRWAGRPLFEIEALGLSLRVPDRDNPRVQKTLLDNISFKALPGDMIALMGPSGAGKTTLLLAMNGYMPPTEGQVRVNGEDLYAIYDNLRGSIGYVPQDDLVHPELTVFEAVRYSAKFRLPPDTSEDEITRRVEQTLTDLGLESVKHLEIGKPEKKILSGGQRKRVNIALELVTDPVLLFLDEPTSGLAADDTSALIALLSDLTKATGKTVIMTIHQPAKDEFERFTHCFVMGYGGVPMFLGPTHDAYRFFGTWKERQGRPNDIDTPRNMFAMIAEREHPLFEALQAKNPKAQRAQARHAAALEWRAEYFQDSNSTYQKMYTGRRALGGGPTAARSANRRRDSGGQLGLLLSRYARVRSRDVSGTAIMLLQAPIIGFLLAMVFLGQEPALPVWCLGALQEISQKVGRTADFSIIQSMKPILDRTGAIFFLVVTAVWFGTSNAAREVVSERAIYLRERMVNLKIVPYVLSKFLLLCGVCIVQCTVLLAIVFLILGFEGGPAAFAQELAALIATSISGVAMGLLLSAVVTSPEAAMALTPIALIPQVVLGGLVVPQTMIPHLAPLVATIPARWGFEAAVVPERMAIASSPEWRVPVGSADSSPVHFIDRGQFECATAQMASDSLPGAWGFAGYEDFWRPYAVLGSVTAFVLLLVMVTLKRRDPV